MRRGEERRGEERRGEERRGEERNQGGIETRFYHSGEDPRWRIYHLTHIVVYNVDQKAVVTDVVATNESNIRLKELEQPQGLRRHTASWRSFSYSSQASGTGAQLEGGMAGPSSLPDPRLSLSRTSVMNELRAVELASEGPPQSHYCLLMGLILPSAAGPHGHMLRLLSSLWCCQLEVLLLLCIADWMVHSMWRSGKDPDSFSIPYLTALGDLLGTALLALSFHFLWVIGDRDSDVGD
ncbi:Solute carrier family 41 member 2 [Takifugu flavidus]|uniref:Solute carrier family 41 member n=1 Tax=Takifugu flavidus TaxID=433684 RepID=A0A5C6NC61_9TELE|nr:Solute carrier family 41 member 2 [Takifugu flavidus]